MGMKFAVYYNASKIMEKLIKDNELFTYKEAGVEELYICLDTHVFWIARIYKNINEDFDKEEGTWLIERNKIDKYDIIDFIERKKNTKYHIRNRYDRDNMIDFFNVNELIESVIKYDDRNMESWDNLQCYSYEECVENLADIYGIIEV